MESFVAALSFMRAHSKYVLLFLFLLVLQVVNCFHFPLTSSAVREFSTLYHNNEKFNFDRKKSLLVEKDMKHGTRTNLLQKSKRQFQLYSGFDDLVADPPMIAALSISLSAIAFAIFKASIYWRMQFITAAMLSRRIVGKNLSVVEVGATDSKSMYYYPTGAVQKLTIVGKGINPGIAKSSGQQLGISVSVKDSSSEGIPNVGRSDADVVVSSQGLKQYSNLNETIKAVSDLLKPKGSFVFIEQLSGDVLSQKTITKALEDSNSFESFDYDIVENLGNPYIVGFAVRAGLKSEKSSSSENYNESDGNRKSRRKKSKKKN
mmetsp:Transcript_10903/g.14197  ORF Transcript_10903/g.14197 Transcript_10903/m.14197 type:complete len:319 (-) Transcript_10903:312-1268(-)|eukprot:CAMPEP_0117752112 /NCGR_PEP_ID=MMETSP0947-20121206/11408_1 /TAXON_ID=44440 /ORGANISM="Chattonella subsalsa, Strain CCMP2191" /LENGTH=318 /DNA_ID=CAMNT_0005570685 /DNA_START=25 /DNA_END=981 /DNA_ORIENTATION=-